MNINTRREDGMKHSKERKTTKIEESDTGDVVDKEHRSWFKIKLSSHGS